MSKKESNNWKKYMRRILWKGAKAGYGFNQKEEN